MSSDVNRGGSRRLSWLVALAAVVVAFGCSDDGDTFIFSDPGGGPGSETPSELVRGDTPAGVNLVIEQVTGARGTNGNFQVGDRITITFRVLKDDGSPWDLQEFGFGRALVSGPSFNYQRVIEEQRDVVDDAVPLGNGRYRYTFPDPIPSAYLPPLNDTPSFGPLDGELTGESLLAGTYTVGLYFSFDFTYEGDALRDAGNATADFLFGSASALAPREVVTQANCNQCHESLRAHGTLRREFKLCLLCHTSGSEDRNDPAVENGTPGVSIDFRVMIHKLHNGSHLPSVLGVAAKPSGFLSYAATPKPLKYVGFNNSVHDFSEVEFPVWPNAAIPTPRDEGYSSLPSAQRALEDQIRRGAATCEKCHGDPDGAGPLPPPAQGMVAYSQPNRRACGACHDDINWDFPYFVNGQGMPPQPDDSACIFCHGVSGDGLAVVDGHLHPLYDPTINPGLNFDVMSLDEAGMNDGDSTIDPGEKISITFTVTDDSGAPVDASTLDAMDAAITGPTSNHNTVLLSTLPEAAFTGPQPYTVNVPELLQLELVGYSTIAPGETFATSRAPHWNVAGAETVVLTRSGLGAGSSTLSAASTAPINFVDVVDSTGFARDDFIVIDEGQPEEEYLQIQWVDGNRLWFSSPYDTSYKIGTQFDHPMGTTVQAVTFNTLVEGMDYSIDAALGEITEMGEFGAGVGVVVTYTSDFIMPSEFPLTLNASPDLDETSGKWTGKSIVDGTYSLTLWGRTAIAYMIFGETNNYRGTSPGTAVDFLVGSAMNLEPYALISDEANCNACHQELFFHGGTRRGYATCIGCHGAAGSEDRPRYRAANAPDTTGVTVNFRTMLHKIHMGEELTNASTYTVVGFGLGYPDNFSEHTYEHVVFPAMPRGPADCAKCHGDGNDVWKVPAARNHPTEQGDPTRVWYATCGSCHDSDPAQAHIDQQTLAGVETCNSCHGVGRTWEVELMHVSF